MQRKETFSQPLLARVTVKLDVASETLHWTIVTIDPNTGAPPADPLIGFLSPGGVGSVAFTIQQLPGLRDATATTNQASVIFDANAPIETAVWKNVVDALQPTSHVTAHASEGATVPLALVGSDAESGYQKFQYLRIR